MKRYPILALALLLGCTIFTGCRRGNGNMNPVPTTLPAVTEMPTVPATQPTRPIVTEPVLTVPTEDSTANPAPDGVQDESGTAATDPTEAGRSRTGPQRPNMR